MPELVISRAGLSDHVVARDVHDVSSERLLTLVTSALYNMRRPHLCSSDELPKELVVHLNGHVSHVSMEDDVPALAAVICGQVKEYLSGQGSLL